MFSNFRRLGLALACFTAFLSSGISTASAAGPFICRPGFYQVISGELKILNPLTGVYTSIGAQGDSYNAMGYNPRDNYLYGWGISGAIQNQLIRIDSSGTVSALGAAGVAAGGWFSGDFDDNNNLYFRKNNTTLIRVNVAANPPTSTELTITSGNFIGSDMGWIGGVMYAIEGTTLYRVNLSTLVADSATITDLSSPSGKEFPTTGAMNYGAIFSNRDNELYASHNGTGRIFKITDYTTSNPRATWAVDGTITSNNDGAACKQAPSPFVAPAAINDTYSITSGSTLIVTPTSGILVNDDAGAPTVLTNTNPDSGTLVMNPDGSFTFTPAAGFTGTTTFTYTAQDQWGRATGTATVTITVAPAATTTPPTVATTTTTTTIASVGKTQTKVDPPTTPATGSGTNALISLALFMIGGGLYLRRFQLRR